MPATERGPTPGDTAAWHVAAAAHLAEAVSVVGSSDDAILTQSLDGTGRIWNGAAERLLGYTAAEMIGRSVFALVPPECHAQERAILARLRDGHRVDEYDTERLASDGRRVPVSLTAFPLADACGAVVGAAAIMRDARPRRAAAVALRRTHARLVRQRAALAALARSPAMESGELEEVAREIAEAAGHTLAVARSSVWLGTDAGDAIRCIDLYEAPAEGHTSGHTSGHTLARGAYPVYFAALEAERIVAAHDAPLDPRTAEFASAYLRPLDITAMLDAPVWADGALAGVVCLEHVGSPRAWTDDEQAFAGSLADLVARALASRQRRRAEAALRRSEEQFRSMIEHAADLITILSADGTITYQSPAAERVLGYRPAELVGTSVFGYLHPDDRGRVATAFQRVAAEQGLRVDVEYRFRHANGTWRVLESRGTNLLDDPAVAGVVANSRDVTERRAAEHALDRQRAELERSNRELEQFAYVASHDLQEPLRKIRAFGDRLADDHGPALGERGGTYLARMCDAARRMQELIADLLTLSRVATTPQPFRPVDLASVVADVVSDLALRIQQTGATVRVDAAAAIVADVVQLRQLLQNLLSNALKFHRGGVPPVVTVRARLIAGAADGGGALPVEGAAAPAGPGPWCRIEVQDNGIGFDEKYLQRIFSPFQRLHGRGAYDGTGMGLAICRKITERHEGTITATSTIGAGTTFVVVLPVHQRFTPSCR